MFDQYERRQLDLIEEQLRADDPKFARRMDSGDVTPLTVQLWLPAILVSGTLLLVAGLVMANFLALMLGGAAIATSIWFYCRPDSHS